VTLARAGGGVPQLLVAPWGVIGLGLVIGGGVGLLGACVLGRDRPGWLVSTAVASVVVGASLLVAVAQGAP
jgi:hypothetical protein